MQSYVEHALTSAGLVGAMMVTFELGRRVARRRMRTDANWYGDGVATLENSVLALLGLLLAFSFSGAWSRFDQRRALIVSEANAIGTAWLRLDLLPDPARDLLRQSFRQYVELRLASTQAGATQASPELATTQSEIWQRAVTAAAAAPDNRVTQSLLPAINEMFDVATTRYVAVTTHPPEIVFWMLCTIALLACLLAGYGTAGSNSRYWLHRLAFVGAMAFAIYVTIDLEFPRRGLIRIDGYDRVLVQLRESMK